jgi:[acyl-carrier-protein] S-malonyltransferase
MLGTALRVLGYDLLQLCLEGPKEKLDDTVHSQVGTARHRRAGHDRLAPEDQRQLRLGG